MRRYKSCRCPAPSSGRIYAREPRGTRAGFYPSARELPARGNTGSRARGNAREHCAGFARERAGTFCGIRAGTRGTSAGTARDKRGILSFRAGTAGARERAGTFCGNARDSRGNKIDAREPRGIGRGNAREHRRRGILILFRAGTAECAGTAGAREPRGNKTHFARGQQRFLFEPPGLPRALTCRPIPRGEVFINP
jgi:hypothetical protein